MEERVLPIIHRYNYLLGELSAVYHAISLKMGLSDSASMILYAICDLGDGCLVQALSHHSGLSKQTVHSALRKLAAEGYLYLETAGGRSKRVRLTPDGQKLVSRTALRLLEMEDSIFSAWPREDVERYLALTERFLLELRGKEAAL